MWAHFNINTDTKLPFLLIIIILIKISESLAQFSSQDGDVELLVVGDKALWPKVGEHIQGEEVSLDDLPLIRDEALVKSVYGIGEEELEGEGASTLLDSVVSRMSSKEFASSSNWANSNN